MKKSLLFLSLLTILILVCFHFNFFKLIDTKTNIVRTISKNKIHKVTFESLFKLTTKNKRDVIEVDILVKDIDTENLIITSESPTEEVTIQFQSDEDLSKIKSGDKIKIRAIKKGINSSPNIVRLDDAIIIS